MFASRCRTKCAAPGSSFGSTYTPRRLAPGWKHESRAQAAHIRTKLSALGYVMVDLIDPRGRELELNAEEIDRLAQAEHVRWCDSRREQGWTYAPVRDNDLKHHPSLVPWSALPEPERDKDRDLVRAIPELLKMAKARVMQV